MEVAVTDVICERMKGQVDGCDDEVGWMDGQMDGKDGMIIHGEECWNYFVEGY